MACQIGDVVGLWLPATGIDVSVASLTGAACTRYADANVTTSNAFASAINNYALDLEFLTGPPYLAVTGDSIAEGHPTYHGVQDSGPDGTVAHEIWNQLRSRVPRIQYQNHAKGSQTFAWALSTGVPACVAVSPHTIVVACGVNDISTGRTWNDVEADLDAIKALVVPPMRLALQEILPWTAGDDTQAATLRTYNTNLLTWCTANCVQLIRCHDAMGQNRVSTGQLDDLATANDLDGVHLTDAGVDALAAIYAKQLQR
jgi:lysophospholipase L1-like esterase